MFGSRNRRLVHGLKINNIDDDDDDNNNNNNNRKDVYD